MNAIQTRTHKPFLLMTTTLLLASLTGCATTTNVSPQYVSPSAYSNYTCQQLSQEHTRIHNYIKQAQKPIFDLASTGVNIGLAGNKNGIYPTINLGTNLGGTNNASQARKANLAKLYGESDAVVQSSRLKNCSFASALRLYIN